MISCFIKIQVLNHIHKHFKKWTNHFTKYNFYHKNSIPFGWVLCFITNKVIYLGFRYRYLSSVISTWEFSITPSSCVIILQGPTIHTFPYLRRSFWTFSLSGMKNCDFYRGICATNSIQLTCSCPLRYFGTLFWDEN